MAGIRQIQLQMNNNIYLFSPCHYFLIKNKTKKKETCAILNTPHDST